MKLVYYKQNNNFGDALNPILFDRLLPGFFDEDNSTVCLGIGSIIHFKVPGAKHTVVFSSGYAYGKVPVIDDSYNVLCVRGPLTAEKLGLPKHKAITDGAALLRTFRYKAEEKKYACSFMPHHSSAAFFNWSEICDELGFHYIDPLDDTDKVITQILQSELIIAEAMHGAIVADTLRVPWVPVKLYETISEFKWQDWTSSLKMNYHPNVFDSLYGRETIKERVSKRFSNPVASLLVNPATEIYKAYQDIFINKKTMQKFSQLKFAKSYLSNESLLDSKVDQLMNKLECLKFEYAQNY